MSEQQPAQGIPPVSGKPAVSGKRKSNKKALTMWGLGLAVLIVGAIFAYHALIKGTDEIEEVEANNEPQVSLTSSRSLTVPPVPPKEPEPKKPEPKKCRL